MSFFEDVNEPPEAEPEPLPAPSPRPGWERPVYVLPASVPGDLLLLHTDLAAVWVGGVRAYPNGFDFQLRAVLRQDPAVGPWLGDPFSGHYNPLRPREPQSGLRLGMRYADGRQVGNRGGMPEPWPRDDDPEALRLISQGGGGSGLTWDTSFWVFPLPPGGPVTLFASWLDAEVAEVSAVLDGAAIRAAAGRAVRLWPSDEDPEDEHGYTSMRVTVHDPSTTPEEDPAE